MPIVIVYALRLYDDISGLTVGSLIPLLPLGEGGVRALESEESAGGSEIAMRQIGNRYKGRRRNDHR
jgi:hypothetical protein